MITTDRNVNELRKHTDGANGIVNNKDRNGSDKSRYDNKEYTQNTTKCPGIPQESPGATVRSSVSIGGNPPFRVTVPYTQFFPKRVFI